MKVYELLTEGKKEVNEAPMGGLSSLANKAMAKMGSTKAAGKLDTGNIANQLSKEFDNYLGKTGRSATKDAVISFLKSKGYPTQGAAQIINQAGKQTTPNTTGPISAAGQLKNKAMGALSKVADKVKSAAKKSADARQAAASEKGKVEPTMGSDASSFSQKGYSGQNYSMSTGFDKDTMKNTSKDMPAGVVGGLPNVDNPLTPKKKKENSSKNVDSSQTISEAPVALSKGIIDKAILKAAQDAEIIKAKQSGTAAPADQSADTDSADAQPAATTSSAGASKDKSFGARFKQGLKKTSAPAAPVASPDIAELEKRIAAIEKKVGLA